MMTDRIEAELTELFEDTRVVSDEYQLVRMAARAADVVDQDAPGLPSRVVAWLGAFAVCGLILVWAFPAPQVANLPSQEVSWLEYEEAVGTYLDVAWSDGSMWSDPLELGGTELSEEAVNEEYAALLDDLKL